MDVWRALGMNLVVVGLFISLWANMSGWFADKAKSVRAVTFGALLGLAAVASMLNAVHLEPGVMFDLRSSVVCAAALFGGPLAAIVAATIAAACRLLLSGAGAPVGVVTIYVAALIGCAGWLAARRAPTVGLVTAVAIANTALVLGSSLLLPSPGGAGPLIALTMPTAILTFFATMGTALVLWHGQRVAYERDLLRAALVQAPDLFYVKNTKSEFVAVNRAVAEINGFAEPRQMVGLTDRNITTADRAERLLAAEQELMTTERPILDAEEAIDVGGIERIYETSKVPLFNPDGQVVGLAGVTRDITESRRLEREIVSSRDLMSMVTAEMSDGVALFDPAGVLVFCNSRYARMFPLTSDLRVPGTRLDDILRRVVETGEQVNLPADTEAWIEGIIDGLSTGSEEQTRLLDGTWLQVRATPIASGAIVVVADITAMKSAEEKLVSLTSQLRVLAATDGLTGLMNRRSFDAALEAELTATAAKGQPLSLLIIDVDHFKTYNDLYGHPAGDACLRIIAKCIDGSMRNNDSAARYGGEEFVAILPDANEDQAFQVAERLRRSLHEHAIAHERSDFGTVTLSIGIASYKGDVLARSAPQLLSRADEALYTAKDAGRNRVMGWHGRQRSASA